jgi:hypothetical protein
MPGRVFGTHSSRNARTRFRHPQGRLIKRFGDELNRESNGPI